MHVRAAVIVVILKIAIESRDEIKVKLCVIMMETNKDDEVKLIIHLCCLRDSGSNLRLAKTSIYYRLSCHLTIVQDASKSSLDFRLIGAILFVGR